MEKYLGKRKGLSMLKILLLARLRMMNIVISTLKRQTIRFAQIKIIFNN